MANFGGPGYPASIFPKTLTGEYPGLGGFRNALAGFDNLATGPESEGYQQLTEAASSDPTAQEFQDSSQMTGGALSGGRGVNAAGGLFAALAGGLGAANVAGMHARDVGKAAALKGVGDVGINAADLMAGRQRAETALENANTEAAAQTAGGINSLLQTATSPGALKLFSGASSMFSGSGGMPFDLSSLGGLSGAGGLAAGDFAGSGSIDAAGALGGIGSTTGAGGFGEMLASLADYAPALFAA